MIITLTGENTFAARQAERQLIDAFCAKHGTAGVERVGGEDLLSNRLPDLLQGASLFAPVRLVILKDVAGNKPLLDPLTEALGHVADGTTVVVHDSHLDKRTKLYKFLKAASNFQDFAPLDDAKLATWAQKIAQAQGAEISAADARHLVQRAGRDQWRLEREVDKLASYAPAISKESIDLLVEATPEGSAFELLDAALAGKHQQVATHLAALKTEEDPYKLFGLLASQVHALAVVAVAGARTPDQIAKDSGIHPFVVRKTQPVAKRLGLPRIQQIAQEVATCDWQLKSTGADPWQLLGKTLQMISVK